MNHDVIFLQLQEQFPNEDLAIFKEYYSDLEKENLKTLDEERAFAISYLFTLFKKDIAPRILETFFALEYERLDKKYSIERKI